MQSTLSILALCSCRPCGPEGGDSSELAATLVAAGLFFVLLSLAVAFLTDKWLVRFVAGFLVLQQLVAVGAFLC